MGEKILSWFEKIVSGEKRRLFFAFLIIVVILGIVVFPYIDANFLYYDRIEKRIDNLSSLVSLSGEPLENNEILHEEYLSILEEMKTARENSLFDGGKVENSKHDLAWKFAGGAILWVVVAIVLAFPKKKGERRPLKQWINNIAAVFFCLVIGAILGSIFVYIPTIGSVELNFVLSPVLQIIILWLILDSPKKKVQ